MGTPRDRGYLRGAFPVGGRLASGDREQDDSTADRPKTPSLDRFRATVFRPGQTGTALPGWAALGTVEDVDGGEATIRDPFVGSPDTWRPRSLTLAQVSVATAGVVLVGLAYRVAVGPFQASCGSPFLFRYIGGQGDPMATQPYDCQLASPGYRHLTFILAGIGLALLIAAIVTTGTRTTPLARTVRWVSTVVAGAAALLLLGGVLAVAQVVN